MQGRNRDIDLAIGRNKQEDNEKSMDFLCLMKFKTQMPGELPIIKDKDENKSIL